MKPSTRDILTRALPYLPPPAVELVMEYLLTEVRPSRRRLFQTDVYPMLQQQYEKVWLWRRIRDCMLRDDWSFMDSYMSQYERANETPDP
jgi:hypothetical protein